ncbi:MAG: hypothetical protein WBC91_01165 [Phototrophicaceae bacterium]
MTDYETVMTLTSQLTLAEKLHLLEHISVSVRQDIVRNVHQEMAWEDFLDLTYGSLADDPIKRPEPLQFEDRDTIE